MKISVDFAVIPAAGIGKRWQPLSSYFPKEMLPLEGRPVIEHVVREVIQSHCRNVVIIINRKKEIIKEFLLSQKELRNNANLHFVYQEKPTGIADAIYKARNLIEGKNFALLFPDMPSYYKSPPLESAIETFERLGGTSHVIAFARYPKNNMLFYGEFLLKRQNNGLYDVVHLCPRATSPAIVHHPGVSLRGAGRNIFSPTIFPLIKKVLHDVKNREVSDGDFLELAFATHQKIVGVETKGFFFDTGSPSLYGQANAIAWQRQYWRK